MKNLLLKELKLTASPLSFIFIAFSLMVLIPSYPILVGAFFICFGIFHTFQSARENNDVLYTVLLPVKKTDAVKARFLFVVFIQLVSFLLMAILTAVRMVCLSNVVPFSLDTMMTANPAFLAYVLLVFTAFNVIFVCGYFKTAYKFGKPFIIYCVATFLIICIAEVLHHIPGCELLNSSKGNTLQWIMLAAGMVIYIIGILWAVKKSTQRFEMVDL